MNSAIEYLNQWGAPFLSFAWPMLWQSSLLMALVLGLDLLLARKIRAAVRYAFWLAVLVKLLLPPTLALPTGAAWWLFPKVPGAKAPARFVVTYDPTPLPGNFNPKALAIPGPVAPKLGIGGWALLGSTVVSAGLLLWLVFRWRQVIGRVRRANEAENLLGLLSEARRLSGLRSTVRLRIVEDQMSPAVCGFRWPVILLPRALAEKLSPVQLRSVLLHEMLHLRRWDVWVNCAQSLLQIVYWWHPLLWVANERIRRVREEAVDDAVMLSLRGEADGYAPMLLDVAKLAFHRPLVSLGLIGIMESRSALRRRIERLLEFRAPSQAGLTVASVCGIFVFSAVALPMGPAPAAPGGAGAGGENLNGSSPDLVESVGTEVVSNGPSRYRQRLVAAITRVAVPVNRAMGLIKPGENIRWPGSDAVLNVKTRDGNTVGGIRLVLGAAGGRESVVTAETGTLEPDREADSVWLTLHDAWETKGDARSERETLRFLLAQHTRLQVHIKARFVELPGDEFSEATRKFLPAGMTNGQSMLPTAELRQFLAQLEMQKGIQILAEPEVVTTSGRHTRMLATQTVTIVTNSVFAENSPKHDGLGSIEIETEPLETGPIFDVVPNILADGRTISLKATASVFKFLGYADSTNLPARAYTNSAGTVGTLPVILPAVELSREDVFAKVHYGQTLVLLPQARQVEYAGADVARDERVAEFIRQEEAKHGNKKLLVLVTPDIVDQAGNRVYSDNERAGSHLSSQPEP